MSPPTSIAPSTGPAEARDRRLALALAGGAILCLAAAGLLMWWREAEAVFATIATAALAWCM